MFEFPCCVYIGELRWLILVKLYLIRGKRKERGSTKKKLMVIRSSGKKGVLRRKKNLLMGIASIAEEPDRTKFSIPNLATQNFFSRHFLRLFKTNVLHRVISYDFVSALYCEVVLSASLVSCIIRVV